MFKTQFWIFRRWKFWWLKFQCFSEIWDKVVFGVMSYLLFYMGKKICMYFKFNGWCFAYFILCGFDVRILFYTSKFLEVFDVRLRVRHLPWVSRAPNLSWVVSLSQTPLRGRINRSITNLVHVLIRDSQTSTCIGGTIIEWYKQRQEICESGRFAPRANCRDQTTRLKEAERLLERYETVKSLVIR